ncbi:MAG: hypothetical protein NZ821_06835 [Gloeomargarita sp. SKYB31]|nr:hypothetical protein [Gloeomargarita sp. SKYB31]
MTTTQPVGHRAKIERVLPEQGNLVISAPVGAPRVRLGYYPPANKFFLYLAFNDYSKALETYGWLREHVGKYNHETDAGACMPRKAKYFGDQYKWEIKVHRPTAQLVDHFIQLDKRQQQQ